MERGEIEVVDLSGAGDMTCFISCSIIQFYIVIEQVDNKLTSAAAKTKISMCLDTVLLGIKLLCGFCKVMG